MPTSYLTKTDFQLARDCQTKLYYKKNSYQSYQSDYIELLKYGGYMIGKIGQLLHSGVEISCEKGIEHSISETKALLEKNEITLYESTFEFNRCLAQIDVLVKEGEKLELIEVKSKSYSSEEAYHSDKKKLQKHFEKQIYDIAFQYYVLKNCLPSFEIISFLMLPDKSINIGIDSLPSLFTWNYENTINKVSFHGDIEELKLNNFLTKVNVSEIVEEKLNEIEDLIKEFRINIESRSKYKSILSKNCKDCEYKIESSERNGYNECWEEMPRVDNHIFDLFYGGLILKDSTPIFNKMISEKRINLFDVDLKILRGARGTRQTIQINYTKTNEEWIDEKLAAVISQVEYPLHFIDFEASLLAIPYHKGMRAYEKVAFQWSCHSIYSKEEEPVHSEWINVDELFPNFEFVKSLKECIGDDGTVLIWSPYESTTLKEISKQMEKYSYSQPDTKTWLNDIINSDRIVDMNRLTLDYYFHPAMKGRTSIKVVLPAVWQNSDIHSLNFCNKYYKLTDDRILNPYETLEKIDIAEKAEVVDEGTGAMMAYQEMLYGSGKNNGNIREKWKKLLLQYCELDSAAMVIIWKYWENKFKNQK